MTRPANPYIWRTRLHWTLIDAWAWVKGRFS